jgi:hypothetical protein
MPDVSFDELLLEKKWRQCAPPWTAGPDALLEGFLFFTSNFWCIRHPERGKILLDCRDAQRETVETWLNSRYTVVLKARQIGFSTLIATYAFWLTFFYPDRAVVLISKTERESAKLLQKAKYGYRFLPEWMKFRGPMRTENTQAKLSWSNESGIESLPSASDPGRGESVFLVVVDEIGYLPNSDEAYAAIEPIADVGGRIIMLGTANGEGNLLHTLWTNSQQRGNRYKGIFFPWSAGDRDQAWYDAKKAELPPWQLAQEYPSNPDEAFLRSGNPVFDVDAVRAVVPTEPRARGYVWQPEDRPREFVNDGGSLAVWEFPQKKAVYVIGADPSEGLAHGDYSCAQVIDATNRRVVAVFHGHVDADLFGSDILTQLGLWYNTALVGVESNNHGLTTLSALRDAGYRNIYRQHRHLQRFEPKTELLGWRTTFASKALAIDELGREIRDGGVELFDADTVAELRTFVREGNGRMHGSPFDDRTMALAIAVQMMQHAWLPEYRVDQEPGEGTMGYIEARMYGDGFRIGTPNGVNRMRLRRKKIGSTTVRGQYGPPT